MADDVRAEVVSCRPSNAYWTDAAAIVPGKRAERANGLAAGTAKKGSLQIGMVSTHPRICLGGFG